MKQLLAYFYNINNIDIYRYKEYCYFYYKEHKYELKILNRRKNIDEIYNTLKQTGYDRFYNKIVLNKYLRTVTSYNGKEYILLRIQDIKNNNIADRIINNNQIIYSSPIVHTNWKELWQKKIDYFEYHLPNIKYKYKILYESMEYYIGLAETAIAYLSNNNYTNDLYIVHERITSEPVDYFNPLNIVIDSKSRDVGEYLKMIFYNSNDYLAKSIDFCNKLKLTNNEYILLIARLIYPSYFFDVYEDIINEKRKEKEIIRIISLNNKYIEYLKKIYNHIKNKANIPTVDWL